MVDFQTSDKDQENSITRLENLEKKNMCIHQHQHFTVGYGEIHIVWLVKSTFVGW